MVLFDHNDFPAKLEENQTKNFVLSFSAFCMLTSSTLHPYQKNSQLQNWWTL